MNLVDQMIVEHMFYLTKTQVMTFINSALIVGSEAPRDGFFKASLVFTKQGTCIFFSFFSTYILAVLSIGTYRSKQTVPVQIRLLLNDGWMT